MLTSYDTLAELLARHGGDDTGYIDGHRVPYDNMGQAGLNCKDNSNFSLVPTELRITAGDIPDLVIASIRLPAGRLRQPVLCTKLSEDDRPVSYTDPVLNGLTFEELQLELAKDGTAKLFGLPKFGEKRVPFQYHDSVNAIEHNATLSQTFGFATARLANIILERDNPQLRTDYDPSPGHNELAAEIKHAGEEVVTELERNNKYLYDLADHVLGEKVVPNIIVGEDGGGRLPALFLYGVMKNMGYDTRLHFINTSKPNLRNLEKDVLRRYIRSMGDQQDTVLFTTENIFSGMTYRFVQEACGNLFARRIVSSATISTITPTTISNEVIAPNTIKPGTATEFRAFEGIPLPPEYIYLATGRKLGIDATTIPRPLGKNGFRYYPDVSILTGVVFKSGQPTSSAIRPSSDSLSSAISGVRKNARAAICRMVEEYTS